MKNLQSFTGLPAIDPRDANLSDLAKKLKMKAAHKVAVLNSPPAYLAELTPAPADLHTDVKSGQAYDVVQLFVNNSDELRALGAKAVQAVKPDGYLWVVYPKAGKNRGDNALPATPIWSKQDVLGELTGEVGFKPVAFVKIDDSWTALRFKKS